MKQQNVQPNLSVIRKPALSFWEHDRYAGVADCLEIQQNDDQTGYDIRTVCDLDIGQTILIELPFSIVPTKFSVQNRDRCFYCFDQLKNFISCIDCLKGFYCNADCMERANHRDDCSIDVVVDGKYEQIEIELVIKTFLNVSDAFADANILMEIVDLLLRNGDLPDDLTPVQRSFCLLFKFPNLIHGKCSDEQMSELRRKSASAYRIIASFPDIKSKYASQKQQRFIQHLIFHLFCIVGYAIDLNEPIRTDSKPFLAAYSLEHYASAFYPVGCHIKHSCIPNVAWFSDRNRLVCTVIRLIKKGEQLYRSYFPGMESFMRDEKLKNILENRYHLKCACHLCTNEIWSPLVDRYNLKQDPLWKDAITPLFMIVKEFRKLSLDKIEIYERKAMDFLQKYNDRHPVRDTISMQELLQIMWCVMASPH